MATLEKIRKRSVLLIVVIGVALLAFIIGDFFKLGSLFGSDTTVVKVDGKKIDAREYSQELQKAQEGNNGAAGNEQEMLKQEVLNNMVFDYLRDEEFNELGISLTDEGLDDAVNGESHAADLVIAQLTGGQVQSAAQYYDYCNNPSKYGIPAEQSEVMKQQWMNFEKTLSEQLLNWKFQSMLAGTMTVNKLDIKHRFADDQTAYNVKIVSVPYSTLADTDPRFEVSDADITAEWDKAKNLYRIAEPQSRISVIALNVVPSPDDQMEASKLLNTTAAELRKTDDLTALRGQKGFNSDRATETLASIQAKANRRTTDPANPYTPSLRQFADTAVTGDVAVTSSGPSRYSIAKVLGTSEAIDSLMLCYIPVQSDMAAQVLDSLNAGVSMTALQKSLGVMGLDSLRASLINPVLPVPDNMQDVAEAFARDLTDFRAEFETAPLGKYFIADTVANDRGMVNIFSVINRQAPVKTLDLGLITYELHPSAATVNGLRDRLQKYIDANSTADKFTDNAVTSNFDIFTTYVSPSTPVIYITNPDGSMAYTFANGRQVPATIPESHNMAVWAKDASKGAVSPIFGDEHQGYFAVMAVNDTYNDYTPATDPFVKANLTEKVRNNKKAEVLIAQYNGKASDIAGYSQLMNSPVDTINVNFLRDFIGAELMGRIITAQPGKVSAPTKADNGVSVFELIKINAPEHEADIQALMREPRYRMMHSAAAMQNIQRILLGRKKIENTLDKVFHEQ